MTPEYAAPEQLKGEAVTAATDVYCLRSPAVCTADRAASSRRWTAYSRESGQGDLGDRASSYLRRLSLQRRQMEKAPVTNARKRATTPDKLARLLRGDLDTIVAKALKKNPQERYPSIKAFADDLQRYLRYEPISARPDAFAYRAGKFIRRHRRTVSPALPVTLALIGTTIFTWFFPVVADIAAVQLSESSRQTHRIHPCSTLRFLPMASI